MDLENVLMTAQRSKIPTFKLSRLREIGWAKWNPIGLTPDDDCSDEYDGYLLHAAVRLWNGASEDEVTDYLVKIEVDYMGLGKGPTARSRAADTVRAIGEYIAELKI
jgi:hypothetical protein